MAPEQSPYFEAVSRELHLGGTAYAYADIDGDPQRAADFLLTLLRDVPELGLANGARGLNATSLVRILGLDRVKAIGWSSYESGGLYRNHSYIHYTGARAGLLRAFGDEPATFAALAVAPQRTDFIWEQQLDLGALVEVVRALAEAGVGMTPDKLARMLAEPVLDLSISLGSVLEGLKARAGVILAIDESRRLSIPGESFSFPYTDFLVQVDGVGSLGDALIRRAASDPFIRSRRTEAWIVVSPSIRLPPPWNAYEPSLIKDLASGRFYVVSSPAFLKECLATVDGVATTPEGARAFEGLPQTGNGLAYMSPRMTRQMHAALDQVIAANGQSVLTLMARFLLPSVGYPVGWVVRNEDEGILFTSNTPSSHKSTLLTLGFVGALPAVVALGSSMSEPDETLPE
jgi:hypothetical protein